MKVTNDYYSALNALAHYTLGKFVRRRVLSRYGRSSKHMPRSITDRPESSGISAKQTLNSRTVVERKVAGSWGCNRNDNRENLYESEIECAHDRMRLFNDEDFYRTRSGNNC